MLCNFDQVAHSDPCGKNARFQVKHVNGHKSYWCTEHFLQRLNWRLLTDSRRTWFEATTVDPPDYGPQPAYQAAIDQYASDLQTD